MSEPIEVTLRDNANVMDETAAAMAATHKDAAEGMRRGAESCRVAAKEIERLREQAALAWSKFDMVMNTICTAAMARAKE